MNAACTLYRPAVSAQDAGGLPCCRWFRCRLSGTGQPCTRLCAAAGSFLVLRSELGGILRVSSWSMDDKRSLSSSTGGWASGWIVPCGARCWRH